MKSSQLLQYNKERQSGYIGRQPTLTSSQLIKQNKAIAIYEYHQSITNRKQDLQTIDERILFDRGSSGCANGGLLDLPQSVYKNTNNIVEQQKRLNSYVIASATNENTDMQNRNINIDIGRSLCNNKNITITEFKPPCYK